MFFQILEKSTGLCLHSNGINSEAVVHGCEPLSADVPYQKFYLNKTHLQDFWGHCLVRKSCDIWRWNVCSDPDTVSINSIWS